MKRWIEFWFKNIKAWKPCNIYATASLGENVSVGRFAEIGHKVVIGANTRIGKGAFIPEGVVIGEDVFIGPHACFTNDMYPPSSKEEWQPTIVCDKAAIGAGVVIRPGVMIGEGALIGAGSVVTKSVPSYEVWAGVPARKIRDIKKRS